MYDNFDLAITYYKKAAEKKPHEPAPYIDAANCFDRDLKIPAADILIDFLKKGVNHVNDPRPLYERLADLYETVDNDEMTKFYRRKLGEQPPPPTELPLH
jgi:hypothetical protein